MAVQAMNTQAVPNPTPPAPKRGVGWLTVLLLLVLVGGLAAAGGWYLAKTDYDKKHAAMQKEMDAMQKEMDASKATAAMDVLTIKEWGVKVPLSNELSGLQYKIVSSTETSFQTPSLLAIGTQCGYGAIGILFRSTQLTAATDTAPAGATVENSMKVGDYYYYYSHAQSSCSDKDAAVSLQTSQSEALRAAIGKISSDKSTSGM